MTPEPLHPPGTEVARLALPMPALALTGATKALEKAYGTGLRLKPEGRWYVLLTPTEKEVELDRRRDHEARHARRQASLDATFAATTEGTGRS